MVRLKRTDTIWSVIAEKPKKSKKTSKRRTGKGMWGSMGSFGGSDNTGGFSS